ncbi:MAG: YihY/virulence factor BrkB family protein [Lewinellaceae bacterium]|nr:YihY/virulence factor BrkB family protein [Saprospiraceae bacterium]MCB9340338.1 YihY/virulence factor BrkB family protein [Lewinellaceae bacterium]
MKIIKTYWTVLKESFAKFSADDMLSRSAALSYYTIFSLPPMLLIILQIATQFYGEVRIKEALFGEIGKLVGREGSMQLMNTINKLDIFAPTWWATIIGIGAVVFTSTTVFVTMQDALNKIFEVRASGQTKGFGILKMLRDRAISFALLISIAFILMVSLALDALISSFGKYIESTIGDISLVMLVLTSILLPLAIITLLFALLFKFLPDAKLAWKDTWVGAFITAILFSLGKYLIGFYIGNSSTANLYDAAGSILVIMIWAYYASAIFLFGATFTYVRAKNLTGNVKPEDYAVRVKNVEVKMEKGADVVAVTTD